MNPCHDLKSLAHVDAGFPSIRSKVLMAEGHELGTKINVCVLLHEKMQRRAGVPSKHYVGRSVAP